MPDFVDKWIIHTEWFFGKFSTFPHKIHCKFLRNSNFRRFKFREATALMHTYTIAAYSVKLLWQIGFHSANFHFTKCLTKFTEQSLCVCVCIYGNIRAYIQRRVVVLTCSYMQGFLFLHLILLCFPKILCSPTSFYSQTTAFYRIFRINRVKSKFYVDEMYLMLLHRKRFTRFLRRILFVLILRQKFDLCILVWVQTFSGTLNWFLTSE